MDWKDGYVVEIEYVRSFHHGMGPSSLNFILMMNGFEPVPLLQGFTYCELGCGQGVSLNLFATCHPEGSFHAVDFNPAHIENARDTAINAGLTNATFWSADFADLGELPLPKFDFITLHGVYSWVSAEKRDNIREFIRNKLKPGGVVYNGYNSLPGWAALTPLRQLLMSCANTQSGMLPERIDRSVEFVEELKGLALGYFNVNPLACNLFDTISSLPRNYLAHEFFNRSWSPFYHADIVSDFAAAGLSFACSARLVDFKDSLRFSAPVIQFLHGIVDPVMKETVKDFAVNQQFRSDVFTRGRLRLTESARMEHLLNCRFALAVPREAATLEVRFPIGMQQLLPGLYDPILCALEEKCQSPEELYERADIAQFGAAQLLEALIVLLAAEYIFPVVEPPPNAVARAWSYNLSVMNRAYDVTERQFLASPMLRSGIPLSWLQLLLLLAEVGNITEPATFVWKHLQERDYKLTKDGAPLQSDEAKFIELVILTEKFRTEQLPLLRKLGAM
jgi:hypothetical protein